MEAIPKPGALSLEINARTATAEIPDNTDLLTDAGTVLSEAIAGVNEAVEAADVALRRAGVRAGEIRAAWDQRLDTFRQELDRTLAAAPGQQSLVALKNSLDRLQAELMELRERKQELEETAAPQLAALELERAALLESLMKARTKRREIRRERVKALNDRMRGIVKLDIPAAGDRTRFREQLGVLKVGSRVREDTLDAITSAVHPAQFAEAMLTESYGSLVDSAVGVDLDSVSRLFVNIADKQLWSELLALQTVDTPDMLSVKFRRDEGDYVPVESLAHGQRCTAMLVALIADGDSPVIVDQPEDALHAPWIEEHLVDRLRDLRGARQYVFATRSPGLVVSADAEQIITLKATAGRGEVEARGSLERHDLNELVLHHLEGGPIPFRRRGRKLSTSVEGRHG